MASTSSTLLLSVFFLFLTFSTSLAANDNSGCNDAMTSSQGKCYNKPEALRLKIIAMFSLLGTAMIGISTLLLTRSIPILGPDRSPFAIVKAFASGVILGTGYMHVLPDSLENLRSPCLPKKPWGEFPFTMFVAMLSAVVTLMIDSFMMTFNTRKKGGGKVAVEDSPEAESYGHGHGDGHGASDGGHGHGQGGSTIQVSNADKESVLLRNRIIAQVLEMGIVVHSVVIGLSMGASQNTCTIKPLVAALCFHQMFEGMGLGGCILQAEYGMKTKLIMVFFFSMTTPIGIALGLGLSNVYSDNSPTALIVVGLLDAASAGLLNYMALVDLLAAEFMGPKLQSNVKLQLWAYVAVLLGAGGTAFIAKWA